VILLRVGTIAITIKYRTVVGWNPLGYATVYSCAWLSQFWHKL